MLSGVLSQRRGLTCLVGHVELVESLREEMLLRALVGSGTGVVQLIIGVQIVVRVRQDVKCRTLTGQQDEAGLGARGRKVGCGGFREGRVLAPRLLTYDLHLLAAVRRLAG